MSKNKKAKTVGVEWLMHSLNAFNGSGYADMDSPEDFIESYIAYKKLQKNQEAIDLARVYKPEALIMVGRLLEHTAGASRQPNPKVIEKINQLRQTTQETML